MTASKACADWGAVTDLRPIRLLTDLRRSPVVQGFRVVPYAPRGALARSQARSVVAIEKAHSHRL